MLIACATCLGAAKLHSDLFSGTPTSTTTKISVASPRMEVYRNPRKHVTYYPYPFVSKIILRHTRQPTHHVKAQTRTKDTAKKTKKVQPTFYQASNYTVEKQFLTQKVVKASAMH